MPSASNSPLTWGLAIATYNRHEVLATCVSCALSQSRPPCEIVIVDGSSDWRASARAIELLVESSCGAEARPRLVHVPAEVLSASAQRNQAIDLSFADVLFLIDDDSWMYPDCAEKVMEVYEADLGREIGGVMPQEFEEPPPLELPVSHDASMAVDAWGRTDFAAAVGLGGRIKALVRRLLRADDLWVPYDKSWPDRPVPSIDCRGSIAPVRLMHGARMTFRREVISLVRFEECLKRYSSQEDNDASYRVSRTHAIVQRFDAGLYHLGSAGGRLSLRVVLALSSMNPCVMHRLHSVDGNWSLREMRKLLLRRLCVQFLADLHSRDWKCPRSRGVLVGLRHLRQIFACPKEEIVEWYRDLQERVIASG